VDRDEHVGVLVVGEEGSGVELVGLVDFPVVVEVPRRSVDGLIARPGEIDSIAHGLEVDPGSLGDLQRQDLLDLGVVGRSAVRTAVAGVEDDDERFLRLGSRPGGAGTSRAVAPG
jgi:hypothetical protein